MKFGVVTLFPEFVESMQHVGVTGKAIQGGLVELFTCNPREFTLDAHRTVDDRPYGGGPGMVMKAAPLKAAVSKCKERLGLSAKTVYLSPQGKLIDQSVIEQAILDDSLILIAGRYEGVDQRFIDMEIDEEWSIGDYVLSGGELPAMVIIDAMIRLLPGVLGDPESALEDSFSDGLLEFPHYTRPEVVDGRRVPEVLLEGNHAEIAKWRRQQALIRTAERRPDLFNSLHLSEEDRQLIAEYMN